MRNILRYIGKTKIDIVDDVMDCKTYCEPFAGSFNVGLDILNNGFYGKTILNDLDKNVFNFWNCLKSDYNLLYIKCSELLSNTRAEKYDTDKMQHISKCCESSLEFDRAAAEFIYRKFSTLKGISFSNTDNIHIYDFFIQSYLISKTIINNKDAIECIQQNDCKDCFFMIDPPYDVRNVDKYYRCNSSNFNHRELYEIISSCSSKIAIIYNENDTIRHMYRNFNIEVFDKRQIGNSIYKKLLIKNY